MINNVKNDMINDAMDEMTYTDDWTQPEVKIIKRLGTLIKSPNPICPECKNYLNDKEYKTVDATTKYYWECPNCGCRYRNIESD